MCEGVPPSLHPSSFTPLLHPVSLPSISLSLPPREGGEREGGEREGGERKREGGRERREREGGMDGQRQGERDCKSECEYVPMSCLVPRSSPSSVIFQFDP